MAGLLAASLAAQSMVSGEEKQNPLAGQKEAIAAGARRFREGCAACHGANAEGGRGPRLVKNPDLFRMTDQQVFNTIRRGIPGTSMPPSQMPDDKTWQVVSFVRSLSSPAYRAYVEGNAARGEQLFGAHCGSCHAIRGHGGSLGPDLSDAGAHMTVAELRQSMTDANAHLDATYRPLTVHMKDGSNVKGVSRDDGSYSLQMVGDDGRLHLIDKRRVGSIEWGNGTQFHTDAAAQLGADDVQDVIAFLAKQVVRPNLDGEARHLQDIH